jgi:hypothetical protein
MGLDALGIPEPTARVIFGCVMIPLVISVAFWEWRTGFYAVLDSGRHEITSAHTPTTLQPGWGIGRFLFVAGTAAALIIIMIMLGYRDLIITFDKRIARGRITRIHQPPPSVPRASDYQVWYEFTDDQELVHTGEDMLPPAKAPSDDERIMVVYSGRYPSVSRIASELSGTPLAGLVLGVGLLLWSVVQFVRTRRRPVTADQKVG